MKNVTLFFLLTSTMLFCSQEQQLVFDVFTGGIEEQNDGNLPLSNVFKKADVRDFSCLFRAYAEGFYLVEQVIDKKEKCSKLLPEASFLDLLPFDSFVNPQLYSLLCDACTTSSHKYQNIADKIVYFNTDRRYPPIAGKYAASCVKTDTFHTIKKNITQHMNARESIMKTSRFYLEYYCRYFGYMLEEHILEPSLCFNSDYKKLLMNIEKMRNSDEYAFAFVGTKDGEFDGDIGHAIVIVAQKIDNKIKLMCMDSTNAGSRYFKISADRVKNMIQNPNFLKDAIVRYVCATKSTVCAQEEIKELGLEDYPLYVHYYKTLNSIRLITMQKVSLLILLLVSLYIAKTHL